MEYVIQVKSSSPNEVYSVTFDFKNDLTSINCDCKAGVMKMLCKHRLNLLSGDISAILNESDVKVLNNVLYKIDNDKIANLYFELNAIEKELKKLNLQKKILKKEIGYKFSDGF